MSSFFVFIFAFTKQNEILDTWNVILPFSNENFGYLGEAKKNNNISKTFYYHNINKNWPWNLSNFILKPPQSDSFVATIQQEHNFIPTINTIKLHKRAIITSARISRVLLNDDNSSAIREMLPYPFLLYNVVCASLLQVQKVCVAYLVDNYLRPFANTADTDTPTIQAT